ncbi:hypothetical protein [Deinococcus aquaticus]|uniref:hypothetical protein n=1 Tax=Deinococcus aquaticus TaxID=328692 RepID=UPI003F485C47
MRNDAHHNESLWLTYQAVMIRLATRRLNMPTEMQQQDSRNDLQYPITLDETTAQNIQTGVQALARQSGLTTIDLLRWMILHLEPHAVPQTRTVEALQLELLSESVAWQQRRFDASIQHHPDPPTLRGVPDVAALLGLLSGREQP